MSSRYTRYERLLQEHAGGVPRLLIDLDRLDANINGMQALKPGRQLRLVAKSLPATGLIRYISSRIWGAASAPRLMVFHLPFLLRLVEDFPDADILMGKPLPIRAMGHFLRNTKNPGARIQWLVDTHARLEQVVQLAAETGRRVGISLELDIGMHRGGISSTEELAQVLKTLDDHDEHVELRGFMGYDAHAAKAPWPASPERACKQAWQRYAAFLQFARAEFRHLEEKPWCINGAGSPTISLHEPGSPLNDFSVGSALLKPTSFDLPSLEGFQAAAWIATPVIKRLPGVELPFLEKLPSGKRDTLFIYGGRWMAAPAYPPDMQEHKLYGLSSNQQMMTVSEHCSSAVDDFVFLRPKQSEAVLLQFGRLFAIRGDSLEALWPVLNNDLPGELAGDTEHGPQEG